MEVTGKRLDTEQNTATLCEPCGVENSETPANGACRECKEYMCSTCFRHHLKSKHTRNHVLLSIDEFSSLTLENGSEGVIRCEKHDHEIIKFYCRSHDVVGCGDCIVLEHTSCKPEYIKDLARTFIHGDMYKAIAKRVENLEEKKIKYGQENENGKGEPREMYEKAVKDIRLFRVEINKRLDDEEVNILSKLKKLNLGNTERQKKKDTCLQALSSELEKVKQKLNTQLHRGNELFINAVTCKSKLSDLEEMYGNKTPGGALKRFEFVRNKQMSKLLKTLEPLGSLKVIEGVPSTQPATFGTHQTPAFGSIGQMPTIGASIKAPVLDLTSETPTFGSHFSFDASNIPFLGTGNYTDGSGFGSSPGTNTDGFVVGARVKRGPDYRMTFNEKLRSARSHGGGPGTIIGLPSSGMAEVEWDNGGSGSYRVGQDNQYDLKLI